jgi:hypothetical protein
MLQQIVTGLIVPAAGPGYHWRSDLSGEYWAWRFLWP